MNDEIIWLDCDQVITHHVEQIRRYGGRSGIRDQGLLDSALMRPRNLFWGKDKIRVKFITMLTNINNLKKIPRI